ncbi:COG2426 family protein [Wansuia hejianensis]|uniref:Small multi-drug export protein n=1 Tax=Wansuia hejianensis TaxID=2763667 RepID=A0A926ILZ7_9FIRM|nr:small multi-drug export protein [Wansuia hejianensis]MBC8590071.1 small multi-drug export protein [Wansuia hejianensis]
MGLIDEIKKELMVLVFSMTPVFELRGAIPLGISLGLHPIHSALISIVGNILILVFLLKLLQPMMDYFEKTRFFKSTVGWVKRRAMRKAGTIKKYSLLGLFLFVAIPIPTTGAWTGAVIATLLKLKFKKALVAMSLGIVTSASIILALYYGIIL